MILTLHLFVMQVITQVLVPSATFPNPLLVAATKAALFRDPFLINVATTLVGCIQCGGDSFFLNCSHTIPLCVSFCARPFLWGALWEDAFDGVPSFPSGVWSAEDKIVLDIISRTFGLSSCVLGHFSLLSAGLGPNTKWARVAKFLGPTMAKCKITWRSGWCPSIYLCLSISLLFQGKKLADS